MGLGTINSTQRRARTILIYYRSTTGEESKKPARLANDGHLIAHSTPVGENDFWRAIISVRVTVRFH